MATRAADIPSLSDAGADLQSHLDQLQQRLNDLQQQVQQLQRLAVLGTMSAMLAHEINNLLTPIVSYTQYALQRKDPEMVRTAAEKALRSGERLQRLAQRVMGMAAGEPGEPRETKVAAVVSEAVEAMGRDLGKDNIDLRIDVPADLSVRTDPSSLCQVLFNLLLNARQALLERGGRIRVAGRRLAGDRVEITVADSGPGIPKEHLDQVFEPFFSTKRREQRRDRQGVGLGLHTCRQLIGDEGGTISVASEFGHGATFTVVIPDRAASQA